MAIIDNQRDIGALFALIALEDIDAAELLVSSWSIDHCREILLSIVKALGTPEAIAGMRSAMENVGLNLEDASAALQRLALPDDDEQT